MLLFWAALAFLGGDVAGAAIVPPALLAVASALLLLALSAAWRRRVLLLWVPAAFLLGLARAPHAFDAASPARVEHYVAQVVTFNGTVVGEPDIRDTGANYVVGVSSVQIGTQLETVDGQVAVHTSRAILLDSGEAVTVTGLLRRPTARARWDALRSPGDLPHMTYPRVLDNGPGTGGVPHFVAVLRSSLESGINTWLPEPEAALLIAIALGAHSASLGALAPVLVSTGLIHLVAISGIKVALLAGVAYELGRMARRRVLSLLMPLIVIWFYVGITGVTASGTRSAVMWTLVFLAAFLGRRTVAVLSLAVALAAMVAIDPWLPWDIGFLLSAVGTVAIVALSSSVTGRLGWLPSPFREALGVTLVAQVATVPIVVSGFHVLSLTGPVANAVVLPFLPALIVLGFGIGAAAGIPAVAAPLSAAADALLRGGIVLVEWFARLSSGLPATTFSPWVGALYYGGLAAVVWYALRRAGWTPAANWGGVGRELLLGLAAMCLLLSASVIGVGAQSPTGLWEVGSGNAVLLRTARQTVLIDGSARPFDLLTRLGTLIPPRLRTIDVVIVTDPAASNVASLEAVLQHYRVGAVLDVGAEYPSTGYARWRQDVRSAGVPVDALRTGVSVRLDGAAVQALAPDAVRANPRDSIGLLRLTVGSRRYLLAGDSSQAEQREAVFGPVTLRANTLVCVCSRGVDPAFRRATGATRVQLLLGAGAAVQTAAPIRLDTVPRPLNR